MTQVRSSRSLASVWSSRIRCDASEHWLELFRSLASQRMRELHTEAEERADRTWVIVWLPSTRPDFDPAQVLDAAHAVIREVNGIDQQFQSGAAQIEAAVRDWWTHQQR